MQRNMFHRRHLLPVDAGEVALCRVCRMHGGLGRFLPDRPLNVAGRASGDGGRGCQAIESGPDR
ncbi:hypothetical protein, partial [Escherichia coli]|uniref:hypothetical protein n=1 Tax=Escherichia coli TaxID=562 RepID=UPI00227F8011